MTNTKRSKMTKTPAQIEATRLAILAALKADAERIAAAEAAERAEIDALRMYSPRREWRTKYGAVFVEGLGFTTYGK